LANSHSEILPDHDQYSRAHYRVTPYRPASHQTSNEGAVERSHVFNKLRRFKSVKARNDQSQAHVAATAVRIPRSRAGDHNEQPVDKHEEDEMSEPQMPGTIEATLDAPRSSGETTAAVAAPSAVTAAHDLTGDSRADIAGFWGDGVYVALNQG
jgi:hypothetical protein